MEKGISKQHSFYDGMKFYAKQLLFNRRRLMYSKKLVARLARKVSTKEIPKVEIIFSIPLRTYIYVHNTRSYFYSGFYERNVVMYLKNIVRKLKPCLFIDIGAYVGYYAILMAKWGCSVVALEPDPRSFALLMNNLFMSGLPEKVIALNEAVCDRENSQIPFKFSKSPSESSSTGYLRGDLVEFMGHVPCTKLDAIAQFLELRDKNMIIKIDVEGAALSVLRGSDSTIKRFKPYIVLEVHRTFDENDEMLAISMLRKYGYKWRLLEWRSQRNFIVALEPL